MGAADLVAQRVTAGRALSDQAQDLAHAGRAMATAFAGGATLFAFGAGLSATDAQHVAVEFVHPVGVGKRALPAMSLATDAFDHQLAQLGRPGDIALGLALDGNHAAVSTALASAKERGLLVVALTSVPMRDVDHCLHVPSDDPLVVRELHVTAYHLLWELTHVFLERNGQVVTS